MATRQFPGKSTPDYICPKCFTYARQRLVHYFLHETIGCHHATLDIAPSFATEPWLKSISDDYLSIDLHTRAMAKMDLTDLDLEDNTKTLVYCSHVLEHIDDDAKAMAEIYRVLQPGGQAIIQVPIFETQTLDDPAITTPEDRLKHFHQEDHVRSYGPDIAQRLEKAGFEVKVLDLSTIPQDDIDRFELDDPTTREVFHCTKPQTAPS